VNPTRTNPDPGYIPISDRMAGWVIGIAILVDLLVVALIGAGCMWWAGAFG
jgi:hypothetical protein